MYSRPSLLLCAPVTDLDETIRSIEDIKGVAGRFELISANQDFPVIVDYAHTPDSLEKCSEDCW